MPPSASSLILPLAVAALTHQQAAAQNRVLAHYQLGKDSAVTYAAAPSKLRDRSANGFDLAVSRRPVVLLDYETNTDDDRTATPDVWLH